MELDFVQERIFTPFFRFYIPFAMSQVGKCNRALIHTQPMCPEITQPAHTSVCVHTCVCGLGNFGAHGLSTYLFRMQYGKVRFGWLK